MPSYIHPSPVPRVASPASMRQFSLSLDPAAAPSTAGRLDAEAILAGLNPAQAEAAAALDGPVLIIAGPGSGKTRTLTHRIAYLLATGKARPWNVLALTFTNKAAREMQERIRHLVGDEAGRGITMGTFHSIFARTLRVEGDALGYSKDFSIYDPDDTERVMKSLMERFRIDPKLFPVRSLRGLVSSAKNAMIGPAEYGRFVASPGQEKAALIYGPYEQALRASNAMDFDDLLLKPIQLFEQHPAILEKYQAKWRYVHIDEYQDTNKAQYTVAKMLAATHHNLCVVGDDAQSIYAFRGADIGNILSFQRDYPEATTVRLEQNYRSTGRILKLADSIIKKNRGQLEKSLWTDNREGEFVMLYESQSERDEALKIERTIRDLQARSGYTFKQFAVLYRTNAQSRSIEDALRRAAIPYRLIGGVSFYARKEIKDALAYLRLLVNPHDAASVRRVINYPARGIGDKTLETVNAFAGERGFTLWQALDHLADAGVTGRAATAIEKFRFILSKNAASLASKDADAVARDVFTDAGLFTEFQTENTPESQARADNVQELLNALAEHVQSGDGRDLATFLQEVSLLTDRDDESGDENRLTLMTLHASKGLEFPVVFVTGMEEGLFPLAKAAQDPKDLEEERRLFYVGVTRAQERLYLTYARTRFRYGNHEASVRSRFLDELDETVVRTESGAAFQPRPDRFSLDHGSAPSGSKPAQGRSGGYTREYDEGEARPAKQATKPGVNYGSLDPHYYRASLVAGKASPAPAPGTRVKPPAYGERSIEYDGDDASRRLVPGAKVEHGQFGPGKILALEGKNDQAKATVFFRDHGQKKLVLKFANLRVVG